VVVDLAFEDETTGAVAFRLSNDGEWDDEEWRPLRDSLHWDLEDGEGEKTVFLQVIDGVGLVSATAVDRLVVDLEPPTGSVRIIPRTKYTGTRQITLQLEYRDSLSCVTGIRLSNDGVWDDEPWEKTRDMIIWTLDDGSGDKTVHLQLKDEWNHFSKTFKANVTLDLDPPNAALLIVGGGDVLRTLDLELIISFWDVTSQVEMMRLSEDGAWQGVPWEPAFINRTLRLSAGDGPRSVYLQVKDSVGLLSTVERADILVDVTSPVVVGSHPFPDQVGVESTTEIFIEFSERMDQATVEAYIAFTTDDGKAVLGRYELYSNDTILFFLPFQPLDNGTRYRLVLGEGVSDITGNQLEAPFTLEFETEPVATTGEEPEEGLELGDALILVIVVFLAANAVLAIILMRTRRRPRRPA
jgi:hypothetical protein